MKSFHQERGLAGAAGIIVRVRPFPRPHVSAASPQRTGSFAVELATLHLSAAHQALNFTLRCNSDMLQKFTDSHIKAVFIQLGCHGCSPLIRQGKTNMRQAKIGVFLPVAIVPGHMVALARLGADGPASRDVFAQ